jgi:hypothetical protein
MTERVRVGGRRRIDRVLDEHFLDGLSEEPTEELRHKRDECRTEIEYLSFLRRLVQGRLDILGAERERRRSSDPQRVVDRLAFILADAERGPSRGQFVHVVLPDEEMALARRQVERLVSDASLSDLDGLTDDHLEQAMETLSGEERDVSSARSRVFVVHDTLQEELMRRYREDPSQIPSGGDLPRS